MGPQTDALFFRQLKPHLKGRCNVTFKVGNQKVENSVILNGSRLSVNTTFESRDIEPFIDEQRKRVRLEMWQANFTDEPTDVYFIPAKILLAQERAFSEFDKARLVKDPDGPKYFVSHRWLTLEHPDPSGKHLTLLKRHAMGNPDAFYWVDYSCLPQSREADKEGLFGKTLPKIASIQAKASTIVIPESDYNQRLWCYVEHLTGVFFSQTNIQTVGRTPRTVEYLGSVNIDHGILAKVQMLQEPDWHHLKTTMQSDIPGIKYNYRWLTNLIKFQLHDRFNDLLVSLPGWEVYPSLRWPQEVFSIDYSATTARVSTLFKEFGGDEDYFLEADSLLWLARRFSWSIFPDDYQIEDFRFSDSLFYSQDTVAWIALLLGIIKLLNAENDQIINLRELYAKIIILSMF